ncbi:hypothetical protein L7F22_067080 [Adiantum nelumboides]|nr:hypothetical protein [Adiantum nelumboides]
MQLLQKTFWGKRLVIQLNKTTKRCSARYSHDFATMPGQARAMEGWRMPHVLTVAGSDSGAGAGIQADLKACGARGVYCSTAITAITAQNTVGVQGIHVTPDDIFNQQLESVLSDMEVDVVKTGMLPTAKIINILCSKLKIHPVQGLVVDPVMLATSGDRLAGHEVLEILCKKLLPLADVVTPNLAEAAILSGRSNLHSLLDMHEAAKVIKKYGPRYVLIKGGHLDGSDDAVDVLYDGESFYELHGVRIKTRNTHGTGCTLASAIAAEMARGAQVVAAVQAAKHYVNEALQSSKRLMIGKGPQGPLNHLFALPQYMEKAKHHIFKPSDLRLYAVTDAGMNRKWQRSTASAVKSAIEGGATIVQLREKEAESGDFFAEAVSCLEVAREHGVPLLINDRLDIAMACGADGVHLGQSDLPVHMARLLLGPHKIIGASCKTAEQAKKAYLDGANYVGSGGVYATTTKKNNQTIGLEGLRAVCEGSPLPVVAIGGINASNIEEVLRSRLENLHGVAVVSALFDKPDVMKETRELGVSISKFF